MVTAPLVESRSSNLAIVSRPDIVLHPIAVLKMISQEVIYKGQTVEVGLPHVLQELVEPNAKNTFDFTNQTDPTVRKIVWVIESKSKLPGYEQPPEIEVLDEKGVLQKPVGELTRRYVLNPNEKYVVTVTQCAEQDTGLEKVSTTLKLFFPKPELLSSAIEVKSALEALPLGSFFTRSRSLVSLKGRILESHGYTKPLQLVINEKVLVPIHDPAAIGHYEKGADAYYLPKKITSAVLVQPGEGTVSELRRVLDIEALIPTEPKEKLKEYVTVQDDKVFLWRNTGLERYAKGASFLIKTKKGTNIETKFDKTMLSISFPAKDVYSVEVVQQYEKEELPDIGSLVQINPKPEGQETEFVTVHADSIR